MKKIIVGLVACICLCQYADCQQIDSLSNEDFTDLDLRPVIRRNPYRATAEVIGTNLTVWGFDKYVLNVPFAQINMHSIKRNLSMLPVWDTDKFSTNLIAHPYHGSLYYNAARSNGMNFWQSLPFTFGGSLIWEYFMEVERPSINDLTSTTFGGAILGEVTFRLSDIVLDNRKVGFQRVVSEVAGGLLSPVRGVNRLVTGEAWRYKPSKGSLYNNNIVDFRFHVGSRYLLDKELVKKGEVSANIGFDLVYGDLYSKTTFAPYDHFRLNAGFDLFSSQPISTQVTALGILWGKNVWESNNRSLTTGIFQHFSYYDSGLKNEHGELQVPYRIAEAASAGGGLIYRNKTAISEHAFDVDAELYVNGVALGANLTDYFFIDERDYNLGSGYSFKSYTKLKYRRHWVFMINLENYQLYTWKGYDPDLDLQEIKIEDINAQGDKGNTRLDVLNFKLSYHSNYKWSINLSNSHYSRYSNYDYHPNVGFDASDVQLSWSIKL